MTFQIVVICTSFKVHLARIEPPALFIVDDIHTCVLLQQLYLKNGAYKYLHSYIIYGILYVYFAIKQLTSIWSNKLDKQNLVVTLMDLIFKHYKVATRIFPYSNLIMLKCTNVNIINYKYYNYRSLYCCYSSMYFG